MNWLWIVAPILIAVVVVALAWILIKEGPRSQTLWTAIGAVGTILSVIFAALFLQHELRLAREEFESPVVTYEWSARLFVDETPNPYDPVEEHDRSEFRVDLTGLGYSIPPRPDRLEREAMRSLQDALEERGRIQLTLVIRNNSQKLVRDLTVHVNLPGRRIEDTDVRARTTECDQEQATGEEIKIRCTELRFADRVELRLEIPMSVTGVPTLTTALVERSQVLDGFLLNHFLEIQREYEMLGQQADVDPVCTSPPWLIVNLGLTSEGIRKMVMPDPAASVLVNYVWAAGRVDKATELPPSLAPSAPAGQAKATLFGPPCV